MRLNKLTLENFRSFKGKHEIEFSPITLLFGGNSVGKSSITKAIKNYDNLSREDVFHGENTVTVRLDFDGLNMKSDTTGWLPEMRLVQVLFKNEEEKAFDFFEDFAKQCNQVGIEKRKWFREVLEFEEKGKFEEFIKTTYYINGEWFFTMQDSEEPISSTFANFFLNLNKEHPILQNSAIKKSVSFIHERFERLEGQARGYVNYLFQRCLDAEHGAGERLLDLSSELIDKGEKLRFPMLHASRIILILRTLRFHIEKAVNIDHLGPLRKIPELASSQELKSGFIDDLSHFYSKRNKAELDSFYTGEDAWGSLSDSSQILDMDIDISGDFDKFVPRNESTLTRVNDWLLNWFNTPYEIKFFEDYTYSIDSEAKRKQLEQGMVSEKDLVRKEMKVRFLNVQNGSITGAKDIGVGISQLTPVIYSSIKSKRFSVEQPELHIHPRMQSIVADLFVFEGLYKQAEEVDQNADVLTITTKNLDGSFIERSFVRKQPGLVSFILVETHSEHLMLRLLKRMREDILKPDDLAIYYFDNDNGKTKTTKIGVDQEGEFTTPWPQGFFEERLEELF